MRVIVFGSEGFIGKNLVEHIDSKFDVIPTDIIDSSRKNFQKVDIQDLNKITEILKGADAVINLAVRQLTSSINEIILNEKVNVIGLLNILEGMRINNVKKIIFPSASSIVGLATENPVTEKHPVFPKTPYGVTKLASEHYLRIYYELYEINYTVFRFFNIYGPHQSLGVIPSFISKLVKNETITLFGSGNQIRDFVFIKDVSKYFESSLNSNITDNKIINMGTGKGNTVLEVVNNISEILGVRPNIEFKKERPGEIGNFVADTSLLTSIFKSKPSTSLHEGLCQTIEWYKKQ